MNLADIYKRRHGIGCKPLTDLELMTCCRTRSGPKRPCLHVERSGD